MYAKGNDIHRERRITEMLDGFEVAGVRTPKPLYSFSTHTITGMVMEELDAVNFQRVVEGQTTAGVEDELPPNFDLEDYFSRLKEYLAHLHEKGIYHGDIALRNLMIGDWCIKVWDFNVVNLGEWHLVKARR